MAQNLDQHFRQEQSQYAEEHRADDHPQDTSHKLGVATEKQLPISQDHPSNYRMQDPHTNKSTHEQIDHHLLDRTVDGQGIKCPDPSAPGGEQTVSPQQQVDRLSQQTDYLKGTGEIKNPGNYNYCKENSEALGMDQRTFNGVEPRSSDMTSYRGVGRPRDSDYTEGGNLRRD